MRILLLSFYYPPDIGPGSLRAESIVKSLKEVSEEIFIDVITTMPNRYGSIKIDVQDSDHCHNVELNRISLPKHNSGMKDQAYAFCFYAWNVLKLIKKQNYDVVVVTSGRLMTAFLGAIVSKSINSKLYLDIRDLFTDTMKDVLPNKFKFLLPVFNKIEKWTFNSSSGINVVSGGFVQHLQDIAPLCEPTVYTNGIDELFLATDFAARKPNNRPVILYAGNLGEGQGLSEIIPGVAKILGDRVQFSIIGDGGQSALLKSKILSYELSNVVIHPPVKREELVKCYSEADILFLHLNDYDAFKKVLPSKIFEYAASGKPILAGVGGYAAQFIKDNVPGVIVFEPKNIEQMVNSTRKILNMPKSYDRKIFSNRYLRKNIMKKMAQDIIHIGS